MATTERSNVLAHRGVPGMTSKKELEEIPTSRSEVRRLKRKYADPLKAWKRGRHEQIKKHISDLRTQKKQVSKSAASKIRGHYIDIERAYRQQGKGRLGELKRGINWIKRLGRAPLPPPPGEDSGSPLALPAPSLRFPVLRPASPQMDQGAQEEPQQRAVIPTQSPYGVRSGPQYALPSPAQRARFAVAADYARRQPSPQYAVVRPVSRRALTAPSSHYEPRQLPEPSAVRTIVPITRPDRLLPAPGPTTSRDRMLPPPQTSWDRDMDRAELLKKRFGLGPITRPDRLLPAAGQTTGTSNAYLRLDTLKKRLSGKKTATKKKK